MCTLQSYRGHPEVSSHLTVTAGLMRRPLKFFDQGRSEVRAVFQKGPSGDHVRD